MRLCLSFLDDIVHGRSRTIHWPLGLPSTGQEERLPPVRHKQFPGMRRDIDEGLDNRTDDMIRTMVAYGLNTGLITCLGSIIIVVLIITKETSMYYVAVYMSLTKVYGISLLAIWVSSCHLTCLPSRGASEATAISSSNMELDTAPIGLFTNTSIVIPENEDM
ncbi:hypothetical protein HWV62_15569 [Athelia sp. TMB]|nr:hypothetical protein HWV62_15569 [Athelia sp. TMB]